MDWALAIDRNREALTRIIAALFAMAGLAEGGMVAALPRHVHRAVLLVLRPAESAVRRLVIIAARGLFLAAHPARRAPTGPIRRGSGTPTAAFALIDPLKRFAPSGAQGIAGPIPRISVPGLLDPFFVPNRTASDEDPVSAARLSRRLQALKRALDDLPGQARRLARWRARRGLARSGTGPIRPGRLSPFRPGRPPGHRRRAIDEIDYVLRECHGLAIDACARPDTS